MKKTSFILLAILFACTPTNNPPDTFSIDSDFSIQAAETLRSVISGWCETVGYCPTEISDPKARGRFVHTEVSGKESPDGDVSAYNRYGWSILIADGWWMEDLAMLWTVGAHEVGHYCTVEGLGGVDETLHTDEGLMAWYSGEYHLTIDYKAQRAWRAGCDWR